MAVNCPFGPHSKNSETPSFTIALTLSSHRMGDLTSCTKSSAISWGSVPTLRAVARTLVYRSTLGAFIEATLLPKDRSNFWQAGSMKLLWKAPLEFASNLAWTAPACSAS
eukprot:CAMPEP_0175291244 /NCGR_PEP_ID=MMETSP0093-20121207/56299_1 /TAXON_ID=311494 /ORGANISM="Alexandrium monilatum, Strain CCMP3105" /LENGTH=109 /DNA_ID=CAMNT_0016586975 /DNA_START=39 /DNA_END=365 /DNA_ORIENTATION=-